MQYMIKNAKSDKTKNLMTELKDLNQVRHLAQLSDPTYFDFLCI